MRVLLTGTPVQNNAAELYALLHMVTPTEFPTLDEFQARFGETKHA